MKWTVVGFSSVNSLENNQKDKKVKKETSYSFSDDLNRQNIDYHIQCFKAKCSSLTVENLIQKKISNTDLLITPSNKSPYRVECKWDSANTPNVCLEIIGVCISLPEILAFEGKRIKLSVGEHRHTELCQFIKKCLDNGIKTGESYGFCFHNSTTKVLSLIRPTTKKWYLFDKYSSQYYIRNNYSKHSLLITKTTSKEGNVWYTISVLIPEKIIDSFNEDDRITVAKSPFSLSSLNVTIKEE